MRRILVVLAVLAWAVPAVAQRSLVRNYPFSASGNPDLCSTSIGCPTVAVKFQNAVGATYTPEIGASYVMTVNGNPTRVSGGTWDSLTSQRYAWRFDGTGDYLSVSDASSVFASDAFSVVCVVVPRAGFAANDVLAAKWNTTSDKRSWRLYTGGTSVVLDISTDGAAGTVTTLTKAAALAIGRLSFITASCDGAGNCSIWVDELAVGTSAAMSAVVYNGNAALTIGADAEAAGDAPLDGYGCAYFPDNLVAADHTMLNRWFRGLVSTALNQVTVGTSAVQSAVQVAPLRYLDMPADTTTLTVPGSGVGGIMSENARDNLCKRGAVETCTGAALTGWAYTICSNGTGTVTCACDTTQSVYGNASFNAMKTVAGTGSVTLYSACIDIDPTKDYYEKVHIYGSAVDEYGAVGVTTWTDNACSAGEGTIWKATGINFPAGWTKYDYEFDSAGWGTAESIMVKVSLIGGTGADQAYAYLDGVELYQGNRDTYGLCAADTDATASCGYTRVELEEHPLETKAAGSWTVEYSLICPYGIAEIEDYPASHYYAIYTEAVGPGNHGIIDNQLDPSITSIRGVTYDSGGADSYQIWDGAGGGWPADTAQIVRFSHTDGGLLGMSAAGTLFSSALNVGTGLLTVTGDMRIGWGGTNANGCALSGLRFYRRALLAPVTP